MTGLAHIKTRSISYNFYPVFESYAVRVLNFKAFEIVRFMKAIRKIERKQKSVVRCQKYSRRLRKLYEKLNPALLSYCMVALPSINHRRVPLLLLLPST